MKAERGPVSALGFTVKSGWACAVLVCGPASSPRVMDTRRIELSDPAVPESRQPYHAGFATARSRGPQLSRLVTSVERFGTRSVTELIRQYRKTGHTLQGTGIIVGSLIDPDTVGNEHIRIHALEGQLFRRVVDGAAARSRLARTIWRERDLYAFAADALKRPETQIKSRLTACGKDVAGPWRAEQKSATLAAWLVLAS